MVTSKVVCLVALALFGSAVSQPAKEAFWKGTPMDGMVEEMRSGCVEGSDPAACIKYKVMSLLDTIFKKDTFQVNFVTILSFIFLLYLSYYLFCPV